MLLSPKLSLLDGWTQASMDPTLTFRRRRWVSVKLDQDSVLDHVTGPSPSSADTEDYAAAISGSTTPLLAEIADAGPDC